MCIILQLFIIQPLFILLIVWHKDFLLAERQTYRQESKKTEEEYLGLLEFLPSAHHQGAVQLRLIRTLNITQ